MATRAREALLEAAVDLMLARGYEATSVDAICAAVGVTKGSFFHYFRSKEALGVLALHSYQDRIAEALAGASFVLISDPLERLLTYLDFLGGLLAQPEVPNSCLFGNLAQEVAPMSSVIQAATAEGLAGWAADIARQLDEAKATYGAMIDFDSASVGRHFVAVYEGALVLSKALDDRSVIGESLRHLRAYLESLFVARGAS